MAYSTKQQLAILQRLKERGSSPVTAQELSDELHHDGFPVSLATVYRQLDRLAEAGRIHKVSTESGALYQTCTHQSGQGCLLLRCENCGRMEHLDSPQSQDLCRRLGSEQGFRVDERQTVLTGRCRLCGKKEDPAHEPA